MSFLLPSPSGRRVTTEQSTVGSSAGVLLHTVPRAETALPGTVLEERTVPRSRVRHAAWHPCSGIGGLHEGAVNCVEGVILKLKASSYVHTHTHTHKLELLCSCNCEF